MQSNYLDMTEEMTKLEERNEALSLRAAAEGIVLLANDGLLPIAPSRVALFGAGANRTVIGGTGSGEVNCRRSVSVLEGLLLEGFEVTTGDWIRRYEEAYLAGERRYGRRFRLRLLFPTPELFINIMKDPYRPPAGPPISETDLALSGTDTAIYVLTRISGEGADQKASRHDFTLRKEEREHLRILVEHFRNVILVLNVGNVFDLSFLDTMDRIGAVLLLGQPGPMGGRALAKILKGEIAPSGHLTDTWADDLSSYPSNRLGTREGRLDVYREGIFVGYRYFDSFRIPVRYPFGHGLSYTSFLFADTEAVLREEIQVRTRVRNVGNRFFGAAVVQVYASLPRGSFPKERQRLVGFARTEDIAPGAFSDVTLSIPYGALSSFDAEAKDFVLERGVYQLLVGESLAEAEPFVNLVVPADQVVSQHEGLFPLSDIRELPGIPGYEERKVDASLPTLWLTAEKITAHVYFGKGKKPSLDSGTRAVLKSLTLKERVALLVGDGMVGKKGAPIVPGAAGYTVRSLWGKGVPPTVMADGPAGLRLERRVAVKPSGALKSVDPYISFMRYLPGFVKCFLFASPNRHPLGYQHVTGFPVGTVLAQTWDEGLLEEIGRAVGLEMRRYGVSFWLAPGMNLHRDPACGRNFEYYSEDPLLSGKMGAAVVRGTGSVPGVCAVPKHFLCNHREDEREFADVAVSERTLRELYLRNFSIVVQEGKPGAVMTSYNKVNGTYTAENESLLTRVLRNEWGFEGLVMSDWNAAGVKQVSPHKAVLAGNDLLMPGMLAEDKRLLLALRQKQLLPATVTLAAARVLKGLRAYAPSDKGRP